VLPSTNSRFSPHSTRSYVVIHFVFVYHRSSIASIAWTITHEELVGEFRDICLAKSTTCRRIYERKFFYLLTCEYCFSHYVTAIFLFITRYKLLFPGWRGYLIAGFSLVCVANVYMSLFARIRLDLRRERVEIKQEESETKNDDGPHFGTLTRFTRNLTLIFWIQASSDALALARNASRRSRLG
jgi:hypothetical protein